MSTRLIIFLSEGKIRGFEGGKMRKCGGFLLPLELLFNARSFKYNFDRKVINFALNETTESLKKGNYVEMGLRRPEIKFLTVIRTLLWEAD